MQKIKEDFLYYVWKTKQFDSKELVTICGQKIDILSFGNQNLHSGPDFSDGKIIIGDTIWAGNVEMHIFSSDWTLHKHQHDDAYKNVILHVVFEHDKDIIFNENTPELAIPTLELKRYIPHRIIDIYQSLLEYKTWIPCEELISGIDKTTYELWKYNIVVQRLWLKTNYIDDLLKLRNQDWEEVFYILIARYFGATANIAAFEQLALSCPARTLYKNLHNPLSIEAILYGQAGFLQADFEDEYFQNLKNEYRFLSKKYQMNSLQVTIWKFGRMMPPGFPTFRIAQLSALLQKNDHFFSKIIEAAKVEDLYSLFSIETHPFWEEHYTFNKPSKSHSTKLTKQFIDRLIINCVVPITFLFGKKHGNEDLVDKAMTFLEFIPSEQNTIISKWKTLNYDSKTALDSQSLIHLKKEYCDKINCMQCRIGHQILKGS